MGALFAGKKPVINGYMGGRIVWPQNTLDLANSQAARTKSDPIFTSNFPTDGFRGFVMRNPAGMIRDLDYGISASPDGSGQIVAWCDNRRGLKNGNEYPRSQVQTQPCIAPIGHTDQTWGNTNDVYVSYLKVWVDTNFTTTSDWINFFEYHGGPYLTSSGMGVMLVWDAATGYHLRLGNDSSVLGKTVPFKVGQWVQLAHICKYAYQDSGGWGDLFYNLTGDLNTGWQRAKIRGGYRLPYDVMRSGEGDGWLTDPVNTGGKWAPSHGKWGPYGNVPCRVYCADHRVGRTFKNTMPPGWNGTLAGINPDQI